jgi:hypothetical protein
MVSPGGWSSRVGMGPSVKVPSTSVTVETSAEPVVSEQTSHDTPSGNGVSWAGT